MPSTGDFKFLICSWLSSSPKIYQRNMHVELDSFNRWTLMILVFELIRDVLSNDSYSTSIITKKSIPVLSKRVLKYPSVIALTRMREAGRGGECRDHLLYTRNIG